jgi:transposase-like protein
MKVENIIIELSMYLNMTDIASAVGVTEATVYRWSGGTKPHKVFLKKLTELLEQYKRREAKQCKKNCA